MHNRAALFVLTSIFLAACGGGGGGGSTTPPVSNPAPQPTSTAAPQPTPTPVANTSLSFYLPLASGNTWTFATGAKFSDMGSGPLQCQCPGNGVQMEQVALYQANSSTIFGSLFFTKTTGNTVLTNLVGVENDSGNSNITISSNAQYPDGVPVMDDNPFVNESWNDGAGDTSTITAVGGTLMLPNNTQVIDIATDVVSGNFNPITWSFAKGVGFTSIGVGNQSTNLTSFFVSTTNSHDSARKAASVLPLHGKLGKIDLNTTLAPLFK